jgi:hypothetical protein
LNQGLFFIYIGEIMDSYQLRVGQILSSSPADNTYSVATFGTHSKTYHNAMVLNDDSGRTFGPKSNKVFSPGSQVFMFASSEIDLAYIVGLASFRDMDFAGKPLPLIPYANTPEDFNWPTDDSLSNIMNIGSLVSNYTNQDKYPGFTAGSSNELGPGYGHTATTAFLKSSEMSGIWSFLWDNSLRIASYNFEFWHSGGERTIKCMGGQIEDIERSTPFTWESLGFNSPDYKDAPEIPPEVLKGAREGDPEQVSELYRLSQLHGRTLEYPDALYRHLKIKGVTGESEYVMKQGTTDHRGNPKQATGTEDADKQKKLIAGVEDRSEPITVGLLEVKKKLDGSYSLKSAKEIEFIKDLRIPVPHQVDKPETVSSEEEIPKNWKNLNNGLLVNSFKDEDYRRQALSKFEYDLPPSQELIVDEDNKTEYYSSQSGIKQADDGSIILSDGYGSQIILSKGNIYLTCPGDVITLPGRDAITWAGQDVMTKAHDNLELSASNEGVRIKAEKQLSLLGGNSGTGGVHIESKASGGNTASGKEFATGGITLSSDSYVGIGCDNTSIVGKKGEAILTVQGRADAITVNCTNLDAAKAYIDAVEAVEAKISTMTCATGKFGGISDYAQHSLTAGWSATAGTAPVSGSPAPPLVPVVVPNPLDSGIHFNRGSGPSMSSLLQPSSPTGSPMAPQAKLTFRTEEELGYSGDYGFAIDSFPWQEFATGEWTEPTVNGTYPHPAKPVMFKTTPK